MRSISDINRTFLKVLQEDSRRDGMGYVDLVWSMRYPCPSPQSHPDGWPLDKKRKLKVVKK